MVWDAKYFKKGPSLTQTCKNTNGKFRFKLEPFEEKKG
jgi:hypothetical protein